MPAPMSDKLSMDYDDDDEDGDVADGATIGMDRFARKPSYLYDTSSSWLLIKSS